MAGMKNTTFLGVVRITDIERAHTGVEVRDEHDFLVERRAEFLVCRVRPEAAADVAEPALGCGHLRRSNRLRRSSSVTSVMKVRWRNSEQKCAVASEVITTISRTVLSTLLISSLPVSVTKSGTTSLPSGKLV